MYFIGIDGGGTKTEFTLIDKNNNIIYNVIKGTCHPNQVGYEGMEEVLREGLDEIKEQLNIDNSSIGFCCLGLAGYGRVESIVEKMNERVTKIFNGINFIIKSDVQIALYGALDGSDGVIVISGTGSIALSCLNEMYERAGGFGYTIGDEGSAYWIGKKTLEYFSKEVDGRLSRGLIYKLLKEELGLKDDYEIINYVNYIINNDRSNIANLSKVCYNAAYLGDENAINIFNLAGEELAALVNVLLKDFKHDNVKISYSGGVFKAGEIILKPFENSLNKRVKIIAPKYSPALGASILAKSLYEEKVKVKS